MRHHAVSWCTWLRNVILLNSLLYFYERILLGPGRVVLLRVHKRLKFQWKVFDIIENIVSDQGRKKLFIKGGCKYRAGSRNL